ncbi:desiccation-related protein pcc13-62 [Phtheirospermum japonicum]|uniref:Desiccation-related protein pcc13-62 n=1 Tax=Phtheirospermum japonicum TaxID=374723 RepID=A0A830BRS5_9LAMI|nr:desiccation-related protein pcc13-62 [Phtheirospermum japonicum]
MGFTTSALTAFFLFLFLLHLRGGNCGQDKFVDSDYVELALNLEYLETEFFLWGALGQGLDALDHDLAMGGPPPFGAQKANLLRIKDIIEQFGYQEVGHLRAIKDILKTYYFPRPPLDISANSFATLINKALGQTLNPPFNPYANDINYLIASYAIPYVGLTAYVGAASELKAPAFKKLVAGLLGVESGQDAVIRTLLYQHWNQPVWPYQNPNPPHGYYTVADFTAKISALRDALGGDGIKDEGIRVDPKQGAEGRIAGNVLAGNNQSVAYDRSPAETLRIVYASGNESVPGGFFPGGAYGNIAKSYRSL